jgi:hypothetical protein
VGSKRKTTNRARKATKKEEIKTFNVAKKNLKKARKRTATPKKKTLGSIKPQMKKREAKAAKKSYKKAVVEVAAPSESVNTARSGSGGLDKHCMEPSCTGKKITGRNWSQHCGDKHLTIAPRDV